MKTYTAAPVRNNITKVRAHLKLLWFFTLPGLFLLGCTPMVRFKLDELKELPPVHDIHRGKKMTSEMVPTPQTLECHLCHGEDISKNKRKTPSMYICLDCHTNQQAPELPCKRCHMGTSKIFSGVGAVEIGEEISPMAEFDCDDCHDLENKFVVPHDVCFDCHDEEELTPKTQLQKEFSEKLAGVEIYYKQINNLVKSTPTRDKPLINPDEFKRGYIYRFALMDRSRGVHNNGFVMQLLSEADRTLSRLSGYYDKYITRLARETKSTNPKARRNALAILGEINDERTQNILIETLQNPDPGMRTSAILMLGKIGGDKSRNALIGLLQNPDSAVRILTVKMLGKIKGEMSVDALAGTIKDKDIKVREEVVTILGEIGGKKAVEALTRSLKDPNFGVRWRAETALKKLKTKAAAKKRNKRGQDEMLRKWSQ